MNRALNLSLSLALMAGAGACTDREESRVPVAMQGKGVEVTAEHEVRMYSRPHTLEDSTGVIRIGEKVTAWCYANSATINADSAGVTTLDGSQGYVFVDGREGGNKIDMFDQPPEELDAKLEDC